MSNDTLKAIFHLNLMLNETNWEKQGKADISSQPTVQTRIRTRVDQQAVAEAGGAQTDKLNEISYRMQCSREIIFCIVIKNILLCKYM